MKSLLLLLVLAAGSPDELAKSLKDLFDDDLQAGTLGRGPAALEGWFPQLPTLNQVT